MIICKVNKKYSLITFNLKKLIDLFTQNSQFHLTIVFNKKVNKFGEKKLFIIKERSKEYFTNFVCLLFLQENNLSLEQEHQVFPINFNCLDTH